MTTGPYWTGDVPSSGVGISLTRDGQTADLGDFTAVIAKLFGPTGLDTGLLNIGSSIEGNLVKVIWPTGVSPFPNPGVYALQVTLTNADGEAETVDPVLITVKDALSSLTLWATPQKVKAVTGATVTQDQIDQATFFIEAITGKDLTTFGPDPSRMFYRNIRILSLAVCYQSAFLASNQGILTDMVYGSASILDKSYSNPGGNAEGAVQVAPMARIALNKVSWRGMRTIVTPRFTPYDYGMGDGTAIDGTGAFGENPGGSYGGGGGAGGGGGDFDNSSAGVIGDNSGGFGINALLEQNDEMFNWAPTAPGYPQHQMGLDL